MFDGESPLELLSGDSLKDDRAEAAVSWLGGRCFVWTALGSGVLEGGKPVRASVVAACT
jgi:hypothetical protein